MANFDDVLKKASPPTRKLPLCLAGDILEEIDELERRLEDAPAPTSLGDSARREIAEAILAAQERMRESIVDFHLRAMPVRGEDGWTAFVVRQPNPVENESKEAYSARMFPWHAEMVSRSCVDPAMSVEQVEELVDRIHGGAWNRLVFACLDLNGGKLDVPNSDAASAMTRDSEPA